MKTMGPRRYSGLPAYSHVLLDARTAFNLSIASKVPLDYVILLTIIGHDSIEDHPNIRKLYNQWRIALFKENPDDICIEEIKLIGFRLKKETDRLRIAIENKLGAYIESSGIKGQERALLNRESKTAVRLIYNLTRFIYEFPYPTSMQFQYRRVGGESILNTLRRNIVKNTDRQSNCQDVAPPSLKDLRSIDREFS